MTIIRVIIFLVLIIVISLAADHFMPLAAPPMSNPNIFFAVPLGVIAVFLGITLLLGYKKESCIAGIIAMILLGYLFSYARSRDGYNVVVAEYYAIHGKPAEAEAVFEKMAIDYVRKNKPANATDASSQALKEAMMGTFYLVSSLAFKDNYNPSYACAFITPGTQHANKAMNLYMQAGDTKKNRFYAAAIGQFFKSHSTSKM